MTGQAVIRVTRSGEAGWQWRKIAGGNDVGGSGGYNTASGAARAAEREHPGVRVVVEDDGGLEPDDD